MDTDQIAIMIPVIVILGSFLVIVLFVLTENRTRRLRFKMLHDERMAALEKGLPVPMDYTYGKRRRPYRSGLVWCAIGVGLMVLGAIATDNDAREMVGVGSIPLLIGMALIAGDLIEAKRVRSTEGKAISPYLAADPDPGASGDRS